MQRNNINQWEPQDFQLETTSIRNFLMRGSWASHNGRWRASWSPHISRNFILQYSHSGDLVLDQFAGGGTTLVEAKLLNRNIIGIGIRRVMNLFEDVGFKLEELIIKIIKEQHNCRSTGYWMVNSSSQHFMLSAHEY